MEIWKKIGKAVLYPPVWVAIGLTPVAIGLLVYAFAVAGEGAIISVVGYVISAYMLTVWCFRIPNIVCWVRKMRTDNAYWLRWRTDPEWKSKITLTFTLVLNLAYGGLQLGLGIYHRSLWFYSMCVYYAFLSVMRWYLAKYVARGGMGEDRQTEWKKYRVCGVLILGMHVALSVIMGTVILNGRRIEHHFITCIALAGYTFLAFTLAIVNLVRYKKYNSPVLSAGKAIGMVSVCVSMFTLTTAMLTAFGGEESADFTGIVLTLVGIAVSVFVVGLGIYMCVNSSKKLKAFTKKEEYENGK